MDEFKGWTSWEAARPTEDKAIRWLAEREQTRVPDRRSDPAGYDLLRMQYTTREALGPLVIEAQAIWYIRYCEVLAEFYGVPCESGGVAAWRRLVAAMDAQVAQRSTTADCPPGQRVAVAAGLVAEDLRIFMKNAVWLNGTTLPRPPAGMALEAKGVEHFLTRSERARGKKPTTNRRIQSPRPRRP